MAMSKQADHWLTKVASGARWLFWTLLASGLMTFLAGFAVPLLGGTSRTLRLVSLIPTIASFPLVIGVIRVTTGICGSASRVEARWGNVLLALGAAECVFRVAHCIMLFTTRGVPEFLQLTGFVLQVVGPLVLFAYLGRLMARFDQGYWPTVAIVVGTLLSLVRLVRGLADQFLALFGIVALSRYSVPWLIVEVAVSALVGALALVVLWRFARRFAESARGKCIACGYDLAGTTKNRCPECGLSIRSSELEGIWKCA